LNQKPTNDKRDFGFDFGAIRIDGVPLKDIMKQLADWIEDKVQGIEEGKTETFHREGTFKLLGFPPARFDIKVEISGLSSDK